MELHKDDYYTRERIGNRIRDTLEQKTIELTLSKPGNMEAVQEIIRNNVNPENTRERHLDKYFKAYRKQMDKNVVPLVTLGVLDLCKIKVDEWVNYWTTQHPGIEPFARDYEEYEERLEAEYRKNDPERRMGILSDSVDEMWGKGLTFVPGMVDAYMDSP